MLRALLLMELLAAEHGKAKAIPSLSVKPALGSARQDREELLTPRDGFPPASDAGAVAGGASDAVSNTQSVSELEEMADFGSDQDLSRADDDESSSSGLHDDSLVGQATPEPGQSGVAVADDRPPPIRCGGSIRHGAPSTHRGAISQLLSAPRSTPHEA